MYYVREARRDAHYRQHRRCRRLSSQSGSYGHVHWKFSKQKRADVVPKKFANSSLLDSGQKEMIEKQTTTMPAKIGVSSNYVRKSSEKYHHHHREGVRTRRQDQRNRNLSSKQIPAVSRRVARSPPTSQNKKEKRQQNARRYVRKRHLDGYLAPTPTLERLENTTIVPTTATTSCFKMLWSFNSK